MNKSIKIFIKCVIAPILAGWLFYSLYLQVRHQPDLHTALQLVRQAPFGAQGAKFWLVIVLVLVNWGLEARKWQLLMEKIAPMNFARAFKSVLCGVTLSLNLPNRMGEYAGRVLYVDEGNRLRSISLSIAGSIAQLIITMLMGCFGLVYLVFFGPGKALFPTQVFFWLQLFLPGSIMVTAAMLLFYFRLGWLTRLVDQLRFTRRLSKYISILETFDAKFLLRLLFLSLLRYFVFVLQYIFMLQIMQVNPGYWQSFWLVTVMFWVLAIIPSVAIAELGIRGTVAKTLFSVSTNVIGILAVSFSIWFINLFIPAFIGSLLILGFKIRKDNDTQP